MQRHSSLTPFSRDHHGGLLVALRLKKGGPSSPQDTLWPSDLQAQRDALIRYSEHELFPHFLREELELFPAFTTTPSVASELRQAIDSLLAEHRLMREAIGALSNMTDTAVLAEALRSFGLVLEAHIRTEERVVFPMIELELSKMDSLGIDPL